MRTITVQPNQSMQDVVLTACGTLEGAMAFCRANDVSISDVPAPGTVYVVPEGVTTDPAILKVMADRAIVPGTLAEEVLPPAPELSMTVVLRPLMDVEWVPPDVGVTYYIEWREGMGFVHVYELGEWVSAPSVYTNTKTAWDTGDSGSGGYAAGEYDMAAKELEYVAGTAFLTDEQYMWYSVEAEQTARYEDIEGNSAVYAPMLVYDTDYEELYTMIGILDVNDYGAAEGGVTVGVVVDHGSVAPGWELLGFTLKVRTDDEVWYSEVVGLGLTEIVLPAGNHEVILEAKYQSDGEGADAGPYSFISIAINIG